MAPERLQPERLRRLRQEAGLTQAQLSRESELGDNTTISRWERGEVGHPHLVLLRRVLAVLSTRLGRTVGEEEVMLDKPPRRRKPRRRRTT